MVRAAVANVRGVLTCGTAGATALTQRLDAALVPYLSFFVVSLLARMADQSEDVRRMSASSFATFVRLMPLEVWSPTRPPARTHL